jgi:hypothetical protein
MNIGVIVVSGMNGNEDPIGTMRAKPSEVGTACGLFGSTFILKMDLHFDRYVVSNSIPNFQAVPAIYTSAAIAATITRKGRAQSVSGNIGESIAGLVARRKLGARLLNDVLPVLVPAKKKAPDFVMKLRPMFPASFETATTMVNPAIGFARWPVESKAVSTNGQAGAALRKALRQLGTYWYERYPHEPSVCGYGIAVCFIYRGNPSRVIKVHVFTPTNQPALQAAIQAHRNANTKAAYLDQLEDQNSVLRGHLRDTT